MNGNATVKTFRAPDAMSALNAVKAAFGRDAVILQTREIAGGLFGKPQVEVIAASAMPEASHAGRTAAFERAAKLAQTANDRPATARPTGDLQEEVSALRRVVEELRRRVGQDDQAADGAPLFTGE